jgi:hypothetical protein
VLACARDGRGYYSRRAVSLNARLLEGRRLPKAVHTSEQLTCLLSIIGSFALLHDGVTAITDGVRSMSGTEWHGAQLDVRWSLARPVAVVLSCCRSSPCPELERIGSRRPRPAFRGDGVEAATLPTSGAEVPGMRLGQFCRSPGSGRDRALAGVTVAPGEVATAVAIVLALLVQGRH